LLAIFSLILSAPSWAIWMVICDDGLGGPCDRPYQSTHYDDKADHRLDEAGWKPGPTIIKFADPQGQYETFSVVTEVKTPEQMKLVALLGDLVHLKLAQGVYAQRPKFKPSLGGFGGQVFINDVKVHLRDGRVLSILELKKLLDADELIEIVDGKKTLKTSSTKARYVRNNANGSLRLIEQKDTDNSAKTENH
jgi:hypothetical protein